MFAHFLLHKGTGESQFRPTAAKPLSADAQTGPVALFCRSGGYVASKIIIGLATPRGPYVKGPLAGAPALSKKNARGEGMHVEARHRLGTRSF